MRKCHFVADSRKCQFEETVMELRNNTIDTARGIAMLLVIIQHCGGLSQLILSFHMPLFFIISGLLIGNKKNNIPFLEDVKKNAIRLLIPQVMIGLFECLFIVINHYYLYHEFKLISFAEFVDAILRWWFLLVLFQCRVFLWFFRAYIIGRRYIELLNAALLFILSLIIVVVPSHYGDLPLYCNLVPICLLFMLLGYYCKKYFLRAPTFIDGYMIILSFLLTTIFSCLNDRVLLYSCELGNPILFIVTSLLGSYVVIRFSNILNSKVLAWIGTMCMPIYVFQFHVSQYSRAAEALLLDYIGCQDVTIKICTVICICLFTCVFLTKIILKSRVTRFMFGVK